MDTLGTHACELCVRVPHWRSQGEGLSWCVVAAVNLTLSTVVVLWSLNRKVWIAVPCHAPQTACGVGLIMSWDGVFCQWHQVMRRTDAMPPT
jgi:hypothetical protein